MFNRDILQSLFNEVSKEKPAVGQMVKVLNGKRHDKVGRVVRHIPDKYVNAFRYGSETSRAMTQVRGRYGFAVQVETADGERFWTKASNVMNCYEG